MKSRHNSLSCCEHADTHWPNGSLCVWNHIILTNRDWPRQKARQAQIRTDYCAWGAQQELFITWFPGIQLEQHRPLPATHYKQRRQPLMPPCQTDKYRCHSSYLVYQKCTVLVMAHRWSRIKIWVCFNSLASASHSMLDHCRIHIAHKNGKSSMKSPVLINFWGSRCISSLINKSGLCNENWTMDCPNFSINIVIMY